jgi:crotonobetainyl-CoA:carnitine CoA-transferase CaiB-like acyl-CoA transferase
MANIGQAAARNTTAEDWEAAARRAGVPQGAIDDWKQRAANAPADARRAAEDPANRQAASEAATQAAWWTLLATLLSMAAAVVGAVVGAGPALRLLRAEAPLRRQVVYEEHRAVMRP